MSFWSDQTWKKLDVATAPVRPFKQAQIDDSNYLLSIGQEIYVSSSDGRNTVQQLTESESFSIDPGQFAFLLTEEEVRMPFDKIGFISIRASVKFWGLVNISGFHVDPGYSGKLIFAVFNAGPTRIHLRRGEQVFPLWIADLDQPTSRTIIKKGYDGIPSKLINQVSGEFTTAYQLAEQLKAAKADIADLKSFRLYASAIILIVLVVLSPFIKTTFERLFSEQGDNPTAPEVTAPAGAVHPAPSPPP